MSAIQRLIIWGAPGIFVLLWSTGFIGARLGLPYAEPFTFLVIRFVLVLVILGPLAYLFVNEWPGMKQIFHCAVVGMLLHGCYLGGVFYAIANGMPAGVSALVVSLQPILTLLLASLLLREKPSLLVIILFAIGLLGVLLVLAPGLGVDEFHLPISTLISSFIAVLGISIGTVYQKQFVSNVSLLPSLLAQYFGAVLVLSAFALGTETMQIRWSGEFVFALVWLVFVLSLGAVGMLMLLIRKDSISRVSVLFFLVPGFTVVIANIMFGEALQPLQIVGLVIASAAVGGVTFRQQKK